LKYLRNELRKALDEKVRETFWPVRTIKSSWPIWAMGINEERPRVGGRIWVTDTRGADLRIGVSITYSHPNPVYFKAGDCVVRWCLPTTWLYVLQRRLHRDFSEGIWSRRVRRR